jgi:hypothetical protein
MSQTALSDMNMQNQFNKISVLNVKQLQEISQNYSKGRKFKDIQELLYKFKDNQGLKLLFSNSRTFKNQGLSSFVRDLLYLLHIVAVCYQTITYPMLMIHGPVVQSCVSLTLQ